MRTWAKTAAAAVWLCAAGFSGASAADRAASADLAPVASALAADGAMRVQVIAGVGALPAVPALPQALAQDSGGLEAARAAEATGLVRVLLARPRAVAANREALSQALGAATVGRLEEAGLALQRASKAPGGESLARELRSIRRQVKLDSAGVDGLRERLSRLFEGGKVAAPAILSSGRDGAADPRGKALLAVGTLESRPFILEEYAKTADALGMRLYLLDRPEARAASKGVIADRYFVPAPVFSHDPAVMKQVVRQVAALHQDEPLHAVYTALNPTARLAGAIRDRLGALGDSGRAVDVAHHKLLARRAMNRFPQLYTPAFELVSPRQAARLYNRLSGDGRYKVVVKPIQGAASAKVTVNIGSAKDLAEVYAETDAGLRAFANAPDAAFDTLDHYPGIMAERQLEGPEVDLEVVTQRFRRLFGMMSDNPPMDPPYAVEKGVTYPSQLSAELVRAGVDAGMLALQALNLPDGNGHIEMILTEEGWRIIEVNKRMGGLFVWEMIHGITGVNLIDAGIRSVLGLGQAMDPAPSAVREARMIIPKVSGTIVGLDGVDQMSASPGVKIVRMLKKTGDGVLAAPDNSFDYIGYIGVDGKDYPESFARTMDALRALTIRVRTKDGAVVSQKGDHSHAAVDMNSLVPQNLRRQP